MSTIYSYWPDLSYISENVDPSKMKYRRHIVVDIHQGDDSWNKFVEQTKKGVDNDKKLKLAQICYWDLSSQNVLDKVFPKGFDPKIEHAGISETSIIMYLFPELNIDCKNVKIKSSNQHKFDLFDFEKMNNEICIASVLADPTESSAVKGKILWDDFISNINKIIATTF